MRGMEKLRTRLILDYLRKKRHVTLSELMRKFSVSSATIHRDVAELSRRDAVTIVRGGLVFNENPRASEPASAYSERVVANRTAKIAAARQALATISEGDIIFLDSSTTVYELAMLLKSSLITHLTIVTNSLAIMQNFRKFPQEWVMIGLGGCYDSQLNSILGATAISELKSLNITKAYISAFGIDANSATTNHERQAEMLKTVIALSDKSFLLADRSKLGRTGIYRLASRSAFTKVFS